LTVEIVKRTELRDVVVLTVRRSSPFLLRPFQTFTITPTTVRHDGAKRRLSCRVRADSMQPCCTRDEGGPLGPGLQDQGSNHRKLLRHNSWGGERCGKGGSKPVRCLLVRRTQVNR
jgi:hypothetical protein